MTGQQFSDKQRVDPRTFNQWEGGYGVHLKGWGVHLNVYFPCKLVP